MYILYSDKIDRYYVGSTNNIKDRLRRHNTGQGNYTKKGMPWELISSYEFSNRSEAVSFEKKIKKRGIKRFLLDSNSGV